MFHIKFARRGLLMAYSGLIPYKELFLPLLLLFVICEWKGRRKEYPLMMVSGHSIAIRWGVYLVLFLSIICLLTSNAVFIYQNF